MVTSDDVIGFSNDGAFNHFVIVWIVHYNLQLPRNRNDFGETSDNGDVSVHIGKKAFRTFALELGSIRPTIRHMSL